MREGKYVDVDGIRTHYFEAGVEHRGKRPSVLLLHSAEYGGAAEFSWEFNAPALARVIPSFEEASSRSFMRSSFIATFLSPLHAARSTALAPASNR